MKPRRVARLSDFAPAEQALLRALLAQRKEPAASDLPAGSDAGGRRRERPQPTP
jgi:hypothetical protein